MNKSRGRRHRTSSLATGTLECKRDAKKGAWKNCKHESILDRWQNDEQYRAGQAEEHGWTFEWVKYLDFSIWRHKEAMKKTSQAGPVRNRKIGDKATVSNADFQTVNSEIFFIFPRAKEHGETTNLILQSMHNWSGYAKIGTAVTQHLLHPPRHGRKPRHGGISQRWEDHQQRREWREWQDQWWWEREQTPTMTKKTLVLAPRN